MFTKSCGNLLYSPENWHRHLFPMQFVGLGVFQMWGPDRFGETFDLGHQFIHKFRNLEFVPVAQLHTGMIFKPLNHRDMVRVEVEYVASSAFFLEFVYSD